MPDLKTRSRQAELMDNPDINPDELDHAMQHLENVNKWLNGYGPTLAGIEDLLPPDAQEFSLLDVGCGSGDTLRKIADWARARGYTTKLTGIELSTRSAERAAQACAKYPEITIRHQNIFDMPADEQYDITHCALVLHHFADDAAAVAVLRRMGEAARQGVVVNDLHRHLVAYWSIYGLTRGLSRSHVLQNDAPLSVARSFTRTELKDFATRAGWTDVYIEWHWAFRWMMRGRPQLDNHANPS